MKKIPSRFHTRSLKASYTAGYKRGLSGLESQVALRGPDSKDAYQQGYSDGQAARDRHAEKEEVAA